MSLRLPKGISGDERHAAWIRVIERIYTEQANHAWSHYMFRLLQAVFDNNERLSDEGGFIFDWMAENYVDAALMLLRRELDQQAGAENLRNLLHDIMEHHGVLTRARYCAAWRKSGAFDAELANRAFNSFSPKRVAENPDLDFIDPELVRVDLDQVVADAEGLREYAERTRAHRTLERGFDTSDITFQALHKAIANVRAVVAKFYALLTLSSIGRWEAVPQFDTIEPFERAWVLDRDAVATAAEEGAEQ
jgi:hypothetical protein